MAAGLAHRAKGRDPAESFWHLFECLHANYDGWTQEIRLGAVGDRDLHMLLRTRARRQGPLLGARRLVSSLIGGRPTKPVVFLTVPATSWRDSVSNGLLRGRRGTFCTRRKLPRLHSGSLGGLGR